MSNEEMKTEMAAVATPEILAESAPLPKLSPKPKRETNNPEPSTPISEQLSKKDAEIARLKREKEELAKLAAEKDAQLSRVAKAVTPKVEKKKSFWDDDDEEEETSTESGSDDDDE